MKPSNITTITQTEKILVSRSITTTQVVQKSNEVILISPKPQDSDKAFATQISTRRYFFARKEIPEMSTEEKIKRAGLIKKTKEQPYSDSRIDNHMVCDINYDRNLMPENRKFSKKNDIVNEVEKETKNYRDAGENRLVNNQFYLDINKKTLNKFFDPKSIMNGELRGHRFNMNSQLGTFYSIPDGGVSAIKIASDMKIDANDVSYHSKLVTENEDSAKNAVELAIAIKYSKLTKRQVYVTGDVSLNDPEIQKFIEGIKVEEPKNSKQSLFDILVKTKNSKGEEVIFFADAKTRSNVSGFSKESMSRHVDTNTVEILDFGTASPEDQIKIHKKISEHAIEVCNKNPYAIDIEKKRAEILRYGETCDPRELVTARFVPIAIFNNDINFPQ